MDCHRIRHRTCWRNLDGLFAARGVFPYRGRVRPGSGRSTIAARVLRSGGGRDSGNARESNGAERDIAARMVAASIELSSLSRPKSFGPV
jgi:hypothetical protein